MCDGDFKPSINEQPGSASVMQGVAESINGIGYKTSGVRALPLAKDDQPSLSRSGSGDDDVTYYAPNAENAINGKYPLSRFLYIAVNKHPNRELTPRDREFLSMVLSKQGQKVVVRGGYIPLPAEVAKEWRVKLGIDPKEEKKN